MKSTEAYLPSMVSSLLGALWSGVESILGISPREKNVAEEATGAASSGTGSGSAITAGSSATGSG